MLELEQLNGESFDELVERAVKIAGRFGGQWNNFQAADPGMTLVDLFAWLKALQHEYMSVILPESQRRFLALLDIHQRRGRGSDTVAVLSGAEEDTAVPAGTKWLAGGMVFENPGPAAALAAQLAEVRFQGGGREIHCRPGLFDGNRFFEVFPGLGPAPARTPDGRMVLCLTHPIPPGQEFSLYVELHRQVERIPVGEEPFRPMADVGWEVRTDSGWAQAEVLRDDTHEFLFSGLITLRHSAQMAQGEGGFLLRAVLHRDGYDLPPMLTRIAVNAVGLRQQDTQVESRVFEAGQPVALTSCLGRWGRRRVFLKDGDGWVEAAEFTCEEQAGQTLLHLPRHHQAALVVSWAEGRDIVLGSGTGFSGQELPFPQGGVLQDGVELMVGVRTPAGLRFQRWERADDFYSAGPFTRCFVLDAEQDVIRFGDHERGVMPPKGENNILLTGLKTCRGQGSNIKSGSITKLSAPGLEGLRVEQLIPAAGGEDPERFEETAARACQVLGAGAKLVTEEDYVSAVRAVPGLAIGRCRVLTGFAGTADHKVTVVVQGAGRAERTPLEAYEENIRQALNRRRLLNTQIQVVWPQPVRLAIQGRLVTAPHYRDSGAVLRRRVEEFLAEQNRTFGAVLSYGEFYCALDLLECVARVESLRIEAVGERVVRTGTDDIVVPPNSFYELERLDLNLVHSFE